MTATRASRDRNCTEPMPSYVMPQRGYDRAVHFAEPLGLGPFRINEEGLPLALEVVVGVNRRT